MTAEKAMPNQETSRNRGGDHREALLRRRDRCHSESDRLLRGAQVRMVRIQSSEGREDDRSPGGCPFCLELGSGKRVVAEFGTVMAIADLSPVAEGHLLIVTRRHTEDLFTMTAQEQTDALTLARLLRARALAAEPDITGFNVGANCGVSAGQKVMHAHIHFIPRRGDTPIKGTIRNRLEH
jgi:diadenosine tetraphosphate (Ap4A) HIT family hydrolase